MDDNASSEDAQQSDETFPNNGQANDDDSFAPTYGDFDTATAFLDSLDNSLAAKRDELRAEDKADEVIADIILGFQAEAASLTFTAVPAGRTGVMSITATITKDDGEVVLDVAKLDPSDVSKRIVFAKRLEDLHPAIDEADAEQRLIQSAADLAKRRMDSHWPRGIIAAPLLPFVCQEGSKMICDTCLHEIDQRDRVIFHDCGGIFCGASCERRHSCVEAADGFDVERGRVEELEVDAE
jgi:hypothetical protein